MPLDIIFDDEDVKVEWRIAAGKIKKHVIEVDITKEDLDDLVSEAINELELTDKEDVIEFVTYVESKIAIE